MYSFGDSVGQLGRYAWYAGNAYDVDEKYAHRVGQKRSNAFGLYDMHGNVYEWCQDWYDADYYESSPVNDPGGPSSEPSGSFRVLRGGSWDDRPDDVRSSYRVRDTADRRDSSDGFRVVRVSE